MERVNFHLIEKKWQKKFVNDKLYNKNGKKILLSRDVSLPIWKNSYGSCAKLHNW